MSNGTASLEAELLAHGVENVDASKAVHISLGDEYADRASSRRTIADRITLTDSLRNRETRLIFYREGFLEVHQRRGKKQSRRQPIDLRYLDPTPTIERIYPGRVFRAGAATALLAVVLGALATIGIAPGYTAPAAVVAVAAAIIAAIACFYMSQERIRFYTQHGRALTLQLEAGLGCIARHRALLPKLIEAIEAAADEIGDDTMTYLRAEMREHYRLRSAGVLSDSDCSDATARILSHFDSAL